jgi:hypothetical protein
MRYGMKEVTGMGVRECCVQTAFILFTLANKSESARFQVSIMV